MQRIAFVTGGTGFVGLNLVQQLMAAAFVRVRIVSSVKAQRELAYKIIPLKIMVKDCYDWMRLEGRI